MKSETMHEPTTEGMDRGANSTISLQCQVCVKSMRKSKQNLQQTIHCKEGRIPGPTVANVYIKLQMTILQSLTFSVYVK